MACELMGYTADEGRIRERLSTIAEHVLETSPRLCFDGIRDLFLAVTGQEPMFMQLLRPNGCQVHFLFFWKAFGEAMTLAGAVPSEGLHSEIETLRDQVLRRLGPRSRRGKQEPRPALFGRGDAAPGLSPEALVDEVHRAAGMSTCPRFWQNQAISLEREPATTWLGLDELARALLLWVNEAVMWENNLASVSPETRPPQGLLVRLHIYDVSRNENIQTLNRVLAHEYSPVKFGGVFHAGVEVEGHEWSFNYSPSRTRSGISVSWPKKHPHHHYRETVDCGYTRVPMPEVTRIIAEMLEDYPGYDYNLWRRNCCHFADDFLARLGLQGIPGWVHRLARLGANLEAAMKAAQAIKEAMSAGCGGCSGEPEPERGSRRRGSRHTAEASSSSSLGQEMQRQHCFQPGQCPEQEHSLGIFGNLSLASSSLLQAPTPSKPPRPAGRRPSRSTPLVGH